MDKNKKNIVIYTSICGDKDSLREDQVIDDKADYIVFLDKVICSKIWDVREIYKKFIRPVSEAKMFKVLPWQFLDYEYSIWMDGSIAIKAKASELIEKFLNRYDIAAFKHPGRDDIYNEYIATEIVHRYEPAFLCDIERQKYKNEDFPEHNGLYACGILIRRHSEKIKRFCETWWAEISAFTSSDQCSFMYAARKHNLKINEITPGTVWENPYFNHAPHKIR